MLRVQSQRCHIKIAHVLSWMLISPNLRGGGMEEHDILQALASLYEGAPGLAPNPRLAWQFQLLAKSSVAWLRWLLKKTRNTRTFWNLNPRQIWTSLVLGIYIEKTCNLSTSQRRKQGQEARERELWEPWGWNWFMTFEWINHIMMIRTYWYHVSTVVIEDSFSFNDMISRLTARKIKQMKSLQEKTYIRNIE